MEAEDDISEADEEIMTEATLELTNTLDTEATDSLEMDKSEISLEDTTGDSLPLSEESVELAPQAVNKIAKSIAGYFT